MTDAQTVSSEVEVMVDADTAFKAFTEEMNLWWRRGPINFSSDAHRVVEIRCEAGVGGRIMEVLDHPDSDDVFVRARITAWEPPHRLCFQSAKDDVATEVSFAPSADGTRVRVLHTIPAGGVDKGGTAWSRVVPKWFGRWTAERDHVPHEVRDVGRLAIVVRYAKPVAAARFLADAFGLGPADELPEAEHDPDVGYGYHWIAFEVGTALIHVFPLVGEAPHGHTHEAWIYVDDLDAHYQRAKDAGAVIVEEPQPLPGSTFYVAADPEGNRWRFSQARPTQR